MISALITLFFYPISLTDVFCIKGDSDVNIDAAVIFIAMK